MTTKEAIIFESLKLFSVNGYDAVSTRMIAKAVNASDAVIYKHFRSKKEIFDTIVQMCTERVMAKQSEMHLEDLCWKDVEKICMDMFEFQTADEWIVLFRRMLIIEQFKNAEIGEIYRNFFINGPVKTMTAIFANLIEQGYMKEGTPEVYAMELYAPFFMYHIFDDNLEDIKKYLEEHVTRFRYNVVTDECYLDIDDKYKRKLKK